MSTSTYVGIIVAFHTVAGGLQYSASLDAKSALALVTESDHFWEKVAKGVATCA